MQRSGKVKKRQRRRVGALLSAELLIVLPIVASLMIAGGEFTLILSANQKIKQASHLACRIASRPCESDNNRDLMVRRAIHQTLGHPRMIESVRYDLRHGSHTGDDVVVEIELPMDAATPDLLAVLGFSIEERSLHARTVMSME